MKGFLRDNKIRHKGTIYMFKSGKYKINIHSYVNTSSSLVGLSLRYSNFPTSLVRGYF